MADQGLEYTLDISIKEAEKKVDGMFDKIAQKLTEVEKKFGKAMTPRRGAEGASTASGRRGSKSKNPAKSQADEASKAWKEANQEIERGLLRLDRLVEKFGDSSVQSAKQVEKELRNLQKNASPTAFGDTPFKRRRGSRQVVSKKINRFVEEQKQRAKELELQRKFAQAKEDIMKREEEAEEKHYRNLWRKGQRELERRQKQREKFAEVLPGKEAAVRARLDELRLMQNLDQQGAVKSVQLENRAKTEILRIRQLLTEGKVAAAREAMIHLQATLKNEVRAEKQAVSQRMGARRKDAAALSRQNQRLFQIQQAVEDFSFAGFRGAANNLALMASTMEGAAGKYAMWGMLAVSIGMAAESMGLLGSNSKEAADEMDRALDRLRNIEELLPRLKNDFKKNARKGLDLNDIKGRQSEVREDIGENEFGLERAQKRLQALKALQKAEEDYRSTWILSGGDGAPGVSIQEEMLERIRRLKGELKALGVDVSAMKKWSGSTEFGDTIKNSEAHVQELHKKLKALRMEDSFLESLKELAQQTNRSVVGFDNLQDKLDNLKGANDAVEASISGLRETVSKMEKWRDNAIGDIADQIAELQQIQQDPEATEKEQIDAHLKELELRKQIAGIAAKTTAELEDLTAAETQRYSVINDVVKLEQQARKEIESQIQATHQLIEAQKLKIENLKQEKQLSRERFEGSRHDAEVALVGRRHAEREEEISNSADSARNRVKDRAEQIRRRIAKAREQVQKQAAALQQSPGSSRMRRGPSAYLQAVEKELRRREQDLNRQEKELLERIDKREKQEKERNKKNQERAEGSLKDTREGQLSSRADSELASAEDAKRRGEYEKAEHLIKKARETLEQLQQLQLSRVSEGTAESGEAALRRAEDTQGRIEGTFDTEAEAARGRQAEEEQRLQRLQGIMTMLDGIKAATQDKDTIKEMEEERAKRMLKYMEQMLQLKQQMQEAQMFADSPIGSRAKSPPKRQFGGPVQQGRGFLIGEQGPELFFPNGSGRIFDTKDTRGLLASAAVPSGGGGVTSYNRTTSTTNNFGGFTIQTAGSPAETEAAITAAQVRARMLNLRRG